LICWLARSEVVRRRCLVGVSLALGLIPVAGMVRDWRKPYKTLADDQLRDIVQGVSRQAKPGDQIVVMDSPDEVASQFVWYLGLLHDQVAWKGQIDWDRLDASSPRHLWCLYLTRDLSRRDAIMTILGPAKCPLVLAGHEERFLQFGQSYETLEHCEVFHWMCLSAGEQSNSLAMKNR
jgi:hypothetical protein